MTASFNNILPEKEFGKLTGDQFQHLVRTLPELRNQQVELAKVCRDKSSKLGDLLGPSEQTWAAIYEMPFFDQMAHLFIIIGMHEPLLEAWRSDDPLEQYTHWTDKGGALDEWYECHEEEIESKHLLWLAIVFQRNILSIMLFHCSIGHLVQRARDGDDDSFFRAVEVDRAVLGCPTFADRLARAELTADKHFFIRLRKALKGPSKKHMQAIQDLRYSIVALRSLGFDRFTDNDLINLFIKTRLYPNSPGALKNLRKHVQAARKMQPPEMMNSGGRQTPS
jgi:hypothetical protein